MKSKNELRLATFGVRGHIGESFSPEIIIDLTAAFGSFVEGKKIIVGRDTRISSSMLHSAVLSGLLSTGCEVLDFGICPTPILQYSVDKYGAGGAVSISGGHTKIGWNALTLIGPNGACLESLSGTTVLDIFHARDFKSQPWNKIGSVTEVNDFAEPYFRALEKYLDVESIRKAGFTVVIDPVNGAGCKYISTFAKCFGFKLVAVNSDESGFTGRDPEPRPRNAKQAASILPHVNADIGFVLSSDMGRLSIVTEKGETLGEEYTFALIANHVVEKKPGVIVTNSCTTRTIDAIASAHKVPIFKTLVGQDNILSAVIDESAVVGGEGSGSAVIPGFSRGYDGFLMMGVILEAMAQGKCKCSQLLQKLQRFHIVKKQVYVEANRMYQSLETLTHNREWAKGGKMDQTDGFRVDWDDGWVHVRASHTEPMIRIISESSAKRKAEDRSINTARLLEYEL